MEYKTFKLSEISDKIGDGLHGTPSYDENGDYYFINGNNLNNGKIEIKNDTKKVNENEYEKYKKELNNNTLLLSINGTIGNIARYNGEKIILGKSACYINIKQQFNVDFIKYIFNSEEFQRYLTVGANGTTIKNVPLSAIRNCEIKIPNIENQNKIANILGKLDNKILINNQTNDNLQKIAKNQFYELFANKKVNAKFKDLVNIKKKAIKASNKNTNLGYYPIDMLPMNYLVTQNCKSNEEANSSLIEFSKYDILLGSMRVYFHRVCLAADDGITRNTTFVFEPKHKELLYYALLLIDRDEFIDYANKTSKGSTMPYAVWEALSEYEIYLPENNEISDFSNLMYPLFEKMILNEKENRILEQLRDTLLPKLMNGEIDLDKIEI